MTIPEIVSRTKEEGEWSVAPYEPTSVEITFSGTDGAGGKALVDLYGTDPEKELEEQWGMLCREFGSSPDLVDHIYVYGRIVE